MNLNFGIIGFVSIILISNMFSPLAFADHIGDFQNPDATAEPLNFKFLGCVDTGSMIECTYSAWGTGNPGSAASHTVFGIDTCLDFVNLALSMPQPGDLIDLSDGTEDAGGTDVIQAISVVDPDPILLISGIKWDYNFDFKELNEHVFHKIVLDIDMAQLSIIDVAVKAGQSDTSDMISGPSCDRIPPSGNGIVAGELLPIDTTSLLLAGAQTNLSWIVLAGMIAVGASAILIRRK